MLLYQYRNCSLKLNIFSQKIPRSSARRLESAVFWVEPFAHHESSVTKGRLCAAKVTIQVQNVNIVEPSEIRKSQRTAFTCSQLWSDVSSFDFPSDLQVARDKYRQSAHCPLFEWSLVENVIFLIQSHYFVRLVC